VLVFSCCWVLLRFNVPEILVTWDLADTVLIPDVNHVITAFL